MFLYFFACVNLHNGFNIIHPKQHIKKVELQFDSIHSVGSGLPVSKILKNKPHLFVFGNEYSQASLISDIRTNIRELSRFTETDKRKLAFFSIKSAAPFSLRNSGAKITIFFTLGKKNSGKCIFYFVNGQICRGGRVNKKTVESGFAFGFWLLAFGC